MSVYKTIVNIILLIVYVFLFGQQSIIKFFDNAVIVTEDMEHPASIIPPGILTFLYLLHTRSITTFDFIPLSSTDCCTRRIFSYPNKMKTDYNKFIYLLFNVPSASVLHCTVLNCTAASCSWARDVER